MSWHEVHRIQQLESKVRKLEDRLAALEARFSPPCVDKPLTPQELKTLNQVEAFMWGVPRGE